MGCQIAVILTMRSALLLSRFTQPGIRVFDVSVEGDLFEDIDVVRTELGLARSLMIYCLTRHLLRRHT
jgi:hypothetical protein